MTSPKGPIYKNQNTKISKETISLLSKKEIEKNIDDKRKNLMALTAGSYGKEYLEKIIKKFGHKDFDYLIFVYDDTKCDEKIFENCEIIYKQMLKWEYAKKYLTKTKCEKYKYIFFWDEDVDVLDLDYKNVIRIMDINGLELAQPAMSDDSYYSWEIMKKHNAPVGRFTNFVECGPALIFSGIGLEKYLKIVDTKLNKWGWGYDVIASTFGKIKRMGIIDCEIIKHTRPVTSIETSAPKEMYELFKKYNKFEYDFLIYNQLLNFAENIEEEYQNACKTKSDINEHLLILKKYAEKCETVTELGVRDGQSTRAFLAAKPKKLISIDLYIDQNAKILENLNKEVDWNYKIGNTLEIEIKETDLLFLDTLHEYTQLKKELELHGNKAKKYLAFHDTVSFGSKDEFNPNGKGLMPAINEFLEKNKSWAIMEDLKNNNGLMILEKVKNNA
jgi:hypothetical protein